MPTNRELLIAQRKKQAGLPIQVNEVVTEPRTDFSKKIGRPTPKKTGIQTRGLEGRVKPPEELDIELATKGIKDIATPLKKKFGGLEPETTTDDGEFVNTFQGKPIPEDVGIPSNVNIAPERITQPKASGVSSFGLPTDRMPSFKELGGAIGQMFKFIGGVTKKRQALGLIPGRLNIPAPSKGLSLTQKDRATILAKRLDDLTLTDVERTGIKAELDAILNPQKAGEGTDIEAILNE